MLSSSSVPVSAGEICGGGSYIGATETPGSGSRPLYHHNVNITADVQNGRNTIGLLSRNHIRRVIEPGPFRMPFGMKTSTVMPPRIGNGLVVSNDTTDPFTLVTASCSVDPYTPVKDCARSDPAAWLGNWTVPET